MTKKGEKKNQLQAKKNSRKKRVSLNKAQRIQAREMWVRGRTLDSIAEQFNITTRTLEYIKERSTDPKHATYEENWYAYRDMAAMQATQEYLEATTSDYIEQIIAVKDKLRTHHRQHENHVRMFQGLLLREVQPKKVEGADGITYEAHYDEKRIKALGDAYSTYQKIAGDLKNAILPDSMRQQLEEQMRLLRETSVEKDPLSSFENFMDKLDEADDESFLELDPAYMMALQAAREPKGQIVNIQTKDEETA